MDDPALQQSLGLANDASTSLGDAYNNALDESTRANTSAALDNFLQSQLDEIRSNQGSQGWVVREATGSPVQIGDILGGNKQRLPPPPALRGRSV